MSEVDLTALRAIPSAWGPVATLFAGMEAWLQNLQAAYQNVLGVLPPHLGDPMSLIATVQAFFQEAMRGVKTWTRFAHDHALISHSSLAYMVLPLPPSRSIVTSLAGPSWRHFVAGTGVRATAAVSNQVTPAAQASSPRKRRVRKRGKKITTTQPAPPLDSAAFDEWRQRIRTVFAPLWAEVMRFCWTVGDGLGKCVTQLPSTAAWTELQQLLGCTSGAAKPVYRLRQVQPQVIALEMYHTGRDAKRHQYVPIARFHEAETALVWLQPTAHEVLRAEEDLRDAYTLYSHAGLEPGQREHMHEHRTLAWDGVKTSSLRLHSLIAQQRLVQAVQRLVLPVLTPAAPMSKDAK